MARTRIGFVGVGFMGQCAHLRNYAVLPECEVVAIAELSDGTFLMATRFVDVKVGGCGIGG